MRNSKWVLLGSGAILLIPLIAMQFDGNVWTLVDFVTAAGMLLGTGLLLQFVLTKVRSVKYRVALTSAVIVAFLLVWAELAVGIFGTPYAGS